ncbi:Protein FAM60A [Orchesella cincta]|uniref:Protein FAM60A n=1 Tax=Orchesella cincta TaxID=48709 RepID=A0A1D2NB51_ORCCI|nr:Protein FAM60A [Orchesella cincta]
MYYPIINPISLMEHWQLNFGTKMSCTSYESAVVDARAGHGSKPISKLNKVKKPTASIGGIAKVKATSIDLTDKMRNVMKKHISPSESYINSLGRAREHSPSGCSDDVQLDCISSESGSYHSSLAASPTPSEAGDDDVSFTNSTRPRRVKTSLDSVNSRPLSNQQLTNTTSTANTKINRNASMKPRRNSDASHNSFLDLSFWKREKTCCGIIFKGPCGEVLLDRRFLSPCFLRAVENNVACDHSQVKPKVVTETSTTELDENCPDGPRKEIAMPVDCISVDSGYDDSSNSTPEAFKLLLNHGAGGKVPIESLPASYVRDAKHLSVVTPLVAPIVSGEQIQVSTTSIVDPSSLSSAMQCEISSTAAN